MFNHTTGGLSLNKEHLINPKEGHTEHEGQRPNKDDILNISILIVQLPVF